MFVREQLLNKGPLFRLYDISENAIVSEESWPHVLLRTKGKPVRLLMKQRNSERRRESQTLNHPVELDSEQGDDEEERESLLSISMLADPPSTVQETDRYEHPRLVFRAHEPPKPVTESLLPPTSTFPRGKNHNRVLGSTNVSAPPSTRASKKPSEEALDRLERFQGQNIHTPAASIHGENVAAGAQIPPTAISTKEAAQKKEDARSKGESKSVSFLISEKPESKGETAKSSMKRRRQPGVASRRPKSNMESWALQMRRRPMNYEIPDYAAALLMNRTLRFPSYLPHWGKWYNGWNFELQRAHQGGPSYPNPTSVKGLPGSHSGKTNPSISMSQRKLTLPKPPQTSEPIAIQAEDILSQDPLTYDKQRCQEWRKTCDKALAQRTKMVAFPEPPDWPCKMHNRSNSNRLLQACICNLRKAFNVLEYDLDMLKAERNRWHPDRFACCPAKFRLDIQRKAEELYKELNQSKM